MATVALKIMKATGFGQEVVVLGLSGWCWRSLVLCCVWVEHANRSAAMCGFTKRRRDTPEDVEFQSLERKFSLV